MTAGKRLTLHEAIIVVLGDRDLTYREIAEEINERRLYRTRTGLVTTVDVRWRVFKYRHLFEIDKSQVPHRVGVRTSRMSNG